MCLQVLFLGPALPSTFGVVSEKLVVSPVLRTLTLKVRLVKARLYPGRVAGGCCCPPERWCPHRISLSTLVRGVSEDREKRFFAGVAVRIVLWQA